MPKRPGRGEGPMVHTRTGAGNNAHRLHLTPGIGGGTLYGPLIPLLFEPANWVLQGCKIPFKSFKQGGCTNAHLTCTIAEFREKFCDHRCRTARIRCSDHTHCRSFSKAILLY